MIYFTEYFRCFTYVLLCDMISGTRPNWKDKKGDISSWSCYREGAKGNLFIIFFIYESCTFWFVASCIITSQNMLCTNLSSLLEEDFKILILGTCRYHTGICWEKWMFILFLFFSGFWERNKKRSRSSHCSSQGKNWPIFLIFYVIYSCLEWNFIWTWYSLLHFPLLNLC